jgi:non-ribosomal peptide synthetase component F
VAISARQREIEEIVVKSRYVASGYWRHPELTAERFSADLDGKGARLVRTGDLGRINADGLLEFCGRKDHSCDRGVKISFDTRARRPILHW